jgi:8-oxo-dGTP diphosphatase
VSGRQGTIVRAAGGVPWRTRPDGAIEVLLVHRPRYDDWTFPKGKCEGDESDEACACREVFEETGFEAALGHELPPCAYVDGRGRDKVVRYWEVTLGPGAFVANAEVDTVAWLGLDAAAERLSYARDRIVLAQFAEQLA